MCTNEFQVRLGKLILQVTGDDTVGAHVLPYRIAAVNSDASTNI